MFYICRYCIFTWWAEFITEGVWLSEWLRTQDSYGDLYLLFGGQNFKQFRDQFLDNLNFGIANFFLFLWSHKKLCISLRWLEFNFGSLSNKSHQWELISNTNKCSTLMQRIQRRTKSGFWNAFLIKHALRMSPEYIFINRYCI